MTAKPPTKAQRARWESPEEWRDIPGYGDFYQASTYGRIRSKARIVSKAHKNGKIIQQRYSSAILEGTLGAHGHIYIHISVNGKKILIAAHRLILEAFVGPCPGGMEACHNNSIADDNRPENLRWDTHLSNNQDRKKIGRYATGEKHPMAKLTAKEALEIYNSPEPGRILAKKYGVNETKISAIRRGHTWKDITGGIPLPKRKSRPERKRND